MESIMIFILFIIILIAYAIATIWGEFILKKAERFLKEQRNVANRE